jgi:small subunit ribosomal protein S8
MLTDTIGDLLTRIRNAVKAKHLNLKVSSSGVKKNILNVLKQEGFIADYKIIREETKEFLTIDLKYAQNRNMILGIKRVSTPSRRIYCSKDDLKKYQGKAGMVIISTSKGVMTNRDAGIQGVGGEIICSVW